MRGVIRNLAGAARATALCVGLAVILTVMIGVATTAVAANGKPFLLGKQNVATKVSALVKRGAGPALSLKVGEGQAPLAVGPEAGKATNLDADKLDGKDSSDLAPGAVGAWREVGTPNQPEFQNAWRNSGDVDSGEQFSTAALYKDPWGVVHLKGLVEGGGVAHDGSGIIFALPCGYAPAQDEVHAVLSNEALGRVTILRSHLVCPTGGQLEGRVIAAPPSDNAWVSLDGITFRAAGP